MNLPFELVNKIIMMNRRTYNYVNELDKYRNMYKNDFSNEMFYNIYYKKRSNNKYSKMFNNVIQQYIYLINNMSFHHTNIIIGFRELEREMNETDYWLDWLENFDLVIEELTDRNELI
jgi:hypothetical protein